MKQENSQIPRDASKMKVTWLLNSSMCPAGTQMEIRKDDLGWHGRYKGKGYLILNADIRDPEFCRINEVTLKDGQIKTISADKVNKKKAKTHSDMER